MSDNTETAILAGGCFWGVQELLRQREGVISTRVGYTGGRNDNPTYRNHPGHAEAVEIVFDPERISYRDIEASGLWPGKVVTELSEAVPFWEAEPEHQDYLQRIPNGYTCHFPRAGWKLPHRETAA
jgi:peptide-methionine (S)-S-oxide reductase